MPGIDDVGRSDGGIDDINSMRVCKKPMLPNWVRLLGDFGLRHYPQIFIFYNISPSSLAGRAAVRASEISRSDESSYLKTHVKSREAPQAS